MKRLKLSLTALAVVIAVGGAVATHAASHKNVVAAKANYFWYDANGNLLDNTASPNPPIECPGGSDVCARGYINQPDDPINDPADQVLTKASH